VSADGPALVQLASAIAPRCWTTAAEYARRFLGALVVPGSHFLPTQASLAGAMVRGAFAVLCLVVPVHALLALPPWGLLQLSLTNLANPSTSIASKRSWIRLLRRHA
jgi:hypothetical protein